MGERVDLPESHPATEYLLTGGGYDGFVAAASQSGGDFHCATGGWRLCLVQSDGILAIVPFDNEPGLTGAVTGSGVGGTLTVPVGGDEPVAITSRGGEVEVVLRSDGSDRGRMTAQLAEEG